MSLRVLIAEDSFIFRKLISAALAQVPGVEVVGTAVNGRLALARVEELRPDLVTLDMEMPELNGLQVLEAMSKAPSAPGAIMLCANTARSGENTIRALELGAFDFILKPEGSGNESGATQLFEVLRPRIEAFIRRKEIRDILGNAGKKAAAPVGAGVVTAPVRGGTGYGFVRGSARPVARTGSPIVVIGVSTGGPMALAEILPALPKDFRAPVLIVQHMPPLFTEALAYSLRQKSVLPVIEGKDGEVAQTGCAYLAPGGSHMLLTAGAGGEGVIRLTKDPPERGCRPAVDVLFRSVAENFPGRAIAAILTGMGSDGTDGLRQLKKRGCVSIAQDEATCTVFGMPREAILAGLADHIRPLSLIAGELVRQVEGAR